MDRENLQDFTKCIRGFLREIECYSMDMFDDMRGSAARNAVDQMEKAIMTEIDRGVYEIRSAQLTLEQTGPTRPIEICGNCKKSDGGHFYGCPFA